MSVPVPVPSPDPLPILPEDKVTLDLWNWRDGTLQTAQSKRGNGERTPQARMCIRRACDDQIGMQLHDLLDVRRDASDFRDVRCRKVVGADDLRAAPDIVCDLGNVWRERDDAVNLPLRLRRIRAA